MAGPKSRKEYSMSELKKKKLKQIKKKIYKEKVAQVVKEAKKLPLATTAIDTKPGMKGKRYKF